MERVVRDDRVNKTIELYTEPIIKQIEKLTYKMSETSMTDVAMKDGVQLDGEDGVDGNVVSALLLGRKSMLDEMLKFCIESVDTYAASNMVSLEEKFTYELLLPKSFKDSGVTIGARFMNDYLVFGTLMDWYEANGIQYSAMLVDKVQKLEGRVVHNFRDPNFVQHPGINYIDMGRRR